MLAEAQGLLERETTQPVTISPPEAGRPATAPNPTTVPLNTIPLEPAGFPQLFTDPPTGFPLLVADLPAGFTEFTTHPLAGSP